MSRRLPPHAVEKLLDLGAEPGESAGDSFGGADLGRFRLLRELGRGGMGRVYEAEDTQLGRRVALKLMPETVGLSEVMRRRFAREAQAVAKLTHPSIAAVYDATPDYIAMQFVDGSSVLDVPGGDRKTIVRLIRDAALAVQYAHDSGVIHRDLKPSNLMVEGYAESVAENSDPSSVGAARVFVLDFGLAKETSIDSSLSMSGSIVGTPAYMSPEQAEGRSREVDERSDVYGLGATLFACFTKEPPFVHGEVFKLLRKVVEEDARSPRVEADINAIVLKCLAKEPERRYQTAAELAADLTRWLAGEPVVAQPPSTAYRIRKFVARRHALLKAVAIAMIASLAIAVAVLIPIERGRRGAAEALAFSSHIENTLDDAQVLFLSGEKERAQQTLDSGIEECQTFLESYDLAHVRYLLGRLLRARGKRTASRTELDEALRMDPDHKGAHLERGLLLLSLYAGEKAALAFDLLPEPGVEERLEEMKVQASADVRFVRENSEGDAVGRLVDVQYASGELMRIEGMLEEARLALHVVVDELEPAHGEANLALARVYEAKGDMDKARRYSSSAVDINMGFAPWFLARSAAPVSSTTPAALAGTPARIEGLEWVLADFEVAARRDNQSGSLATETGLDHIQRAARLAAAGVNDEAVAEFEHAVEQLDSALAANDQLAGAYVNRGVCHAELEKLLLAENRTVEAVDAHRLALADYDEAVRRAPRFAPAYLDRAMLRVFQARRLEGFGRSTLAIAELRQAVSDFEQVGFLYRGSGEQATSQAALHVRTGQARERWAALLERQGDSVAASDELDLASASYDRAVELSPDSPTALLHRGIARARSGEAAAAETDLRRALRVAPADWPERAECERQLAAMGGDR